MYSVINILIRMCNIFTILGKRSMHIVTDTNLFRNRGRSLLLLQSAIAVIVDCDYSFNGWWVSEGWWWGLWFGVVPFHYEWFPFEYGSLYSLNSNGLHCYNHKITLAKKHSVTHVYPNIQLISALNIELHWHYQ